MSAQYVIEAVFADLQSEVRTMHLLGTKDELMKTIRTTWSKKTVDISQHGSTIKVINSDHIVEAIFTLIHVEPIPDHF